MSAQLFCAEHMGLGSRTQSIRIGTPFAQLCRLALPLLVAAALVMLLLVTVARIAQASISTTIEDTRSELAADYSPWQRTEFQPVSLRIVEALPSAGEDPLHRISGIH